MTTIESNGIGKLRVREDGLLAQGAVENGRLGITGVVEDEARLRPRREQGAPEGSGASSVLAMVKAFRVLETNLKTVRLQDAGTPQ